MYDYKAKVTNVVDGDTMDVTIDLGFHIFTEQRLRIKDYDAPETWRPINEAEEKAGEQATKRAKQLLLDKEVIVQTTRQGLYNRWMAKIYFEDGTDYSQTMIDEGHVKKEEWK